jgi:hypothetical protein
MGAPGPSHLGTGDSIDLNRPRLNLDRSRTTAHAIRKDPGQPRKPLPAHFPRKPLKTRRKNIPQVCRSFPPFGAQWSHDLRTDDRRADRRSSYRLLAVHCPYFLVPYVPMSLRPCFSDPCLFTPRSQAPDSLLHFFTHSLVHFFTPSLLHSFTSSLLHPLPRSLAPCFSVPSVPRLSNH